MGNSCKNFLKKDKIKPIPLLLLGLNGAGKTQIAHKICKIKRKDHLPSNNHGCSFYEVKLKNTVLKLNELGGDSNIREIWYHYFLEAYGVIFVIDCNNLENINEARFVLHNLFLHPYLEEKCFLIIGNKQDLPNAMDHIDLCYFLDIEYVVNKTRNPCRVEVTGIWEKSDEIFDPNLDKSILWLIQSIKKRTKVIKNVIKYYNEPILYNRAKKTRSSSLFRRIKKSKSNKCRPSTAPGKFNTAFIDSSVSENVINMEGNIVDNIVNVKRNIADNIKKLEKNSLFTDNNTNEKLFEKVNDVNIIERQIKSNMFVRNGAYLNQSIDQSVSINITEAEVQVHQVDDHLDNLKI